VLVIQSSPACALHVDQEYLESLADAVLAGEGVVGDSEISLSLTDDAGIRAINRQYRGIDAATDVLSFCLRPSPGDAGPTSRRNHEAQRSYRSMRFRAAATDWVLRPKSDVPPWSHAQIDRSPKF